MTTMTSSRIPGFYRLDMTRRHAELRERFGLSQQDLDALGAADSVAMGVADNMVENCVGVFGLPIGLGLNFTVNGRDYAVPMVIEEPSVVAAASNMARLVRAAGGFRAEADPSVMIGQIQLVDVPDPTAAVCALEAATDQILAEANRAQPTMAARGGGAIAVEVRRVDAPHPMLIVHLLIDCVDAMGANTINTMAEATAPLLAQLSGGRTNLRILSNLADRRCARASCRLPVGALTGDLPGAEVAEGIERAWQFAAVDPYRAATHNKGVMNGIDAVAIATGNDWRGVEAGAHAFAARSGRYTSLTRWWVQDGHLHGSIELPMAVGVVGGSTRVHPATRVARKILGATSAAELGMVMASVGLAQNLGALRALAAEGIQRGHMRLHARQVAAAAGVPSALIERVAAAMVATEDIKEDAARRLHAALNEPVRTVGSAHPVASRGARSDTAPRRVQAG